MIYSLPLLFVLTAPPPKHWAFIPPARVALPRCGAQHPVDALLGAGPVARADRRTLIRRATFDLTGLPPTPQEIDAFVNDPAPDAYARLIDRLLASPHYGEKWGRLWLDVARYADTAGETADFPAPEAWRYRNYVIDAFNRDKPYDQFLREQLAGDRLAAKLPPDAPPERYAELVTATGFLAVARRFGFDIEKDHFLTIEDTIDTLGKAVMGLTIACARCHDHKYDPVSNRDYYALYGIFDSTRFPFPGCEKTKTPRDLVPLVRDYEARLNQLKARVAAAEKALTNGPATPAAMPLAAGDLPNGGSTPLPSEPLQRVRVARGQMLRLTILPKANEGADSTGVELIIRELGGEKRTWNLTSDLLTDFDQILDGTRASVIGPPIAVALVGVGADPRPLTEYTPRVDNVAGISAWRGSVQHAQLFGNTTTKLAAFQTVRLAPRSVAIHPGNGTPVTAAWESPVDGEISITGRVVDADGSGGDGIRWEVTLGPSIAAELTASADRARELTRAKQALADFPATVNWAYAVVEGKPHHVPVQLRGDPDSPGEVVPRGMPAALGGQAIRDPGSVSGREDLGEWLTSPNHPLTARVMVNRIWLGHFGTGIVATPNDFGTRETPPTHPELLDWLARRFIDSGWSIKAMHRVLMLSEHYQRADGMRRRLTGEEVRDVLLAVSGDLEQIPGGPHPFPPSKSWGFTQHGPFTAVYDHRRRGVYLMTQRIKRHPFLALFDGPDPNASTGQRQSTTVPTQALFFLNDAFTHERAASLARRLATLPNDETRLQLACELLYGRPPRADEIDTARAFLAESDWAAWLRVMLAANEFVYID